MKRRRLLWLCVAFLLVGGVAGTWFVLARRDADFHVIGPKTHGMRDQLAMLNTTLDPDDYRACKTVNDALGVLNGRLRQRESLPPPEPGAIDWVWLHCAERIRIASDINSREILNAPFHADVMSSPLTVKEFLRSTCIRPDTPEVQFVVRGHYIEVTTLKQVQEERDRYLNSVTVFDRVHRYWKEMTGVYENDPPEIRFYW